MIKLKRVIHYKDTNSVEATWVDVVSVPIFKTVYDPLDQSVVVGEEQVGVEEKETVVLCHTYADVQMQLFRDHISSMGGNITEHEALIAEVQAGINPPVPLTPEQILAERHDLALSQIRSLEDAVENNVRKVTRLFMIELFQYIGAQNGITPEQLYQDNKGYRGLVDLEAQVAPLRKEL